MNIYGIAEGDTVIGFYARLHHAPEAFASESANREGVVIMKEPDWENGEPVNIEAAALDAIVWLELMQTMMDKGKLTLMQHNENRERLGAATDKLKQMIEVNA